MSVIASYNAGLFGVIVLVIVSIPTLINLGLGIKELVHIIAKRKIYKEAKASPISNGTLIEQQENSDE